MLLGLGVLGWAGERRYHFVQRFNANSGPVVAKVDSRGPSFLADGERALSEGELEKAQGDFDKASVLLDRNPRVLLDLAFVAAAKADVPWLKLRLLPADAKVEARTARAQLDESAEVARRAANDATAVAPTDPQALRAVLDSLRIAGDRDAARTHSTAVTATEAQPQTAYALAMVDLAQPSPPWAAVVERLRVAAAGEGGAGRARAALVYALAKSGDFDGAKGELAKLDALPRPYPLQPELHAFVFAGAPAPVVVAAMPSSTAAGTVAPSAVAPTGVPAGATGGSEPGHESPHTALETAAKAIGHRDFDRAEQIYQGILTGNPNDSQAVAGLGDVASARGNSSGAITAYRRATTMNPSYLPAWLGLADTEWASGDRTAAARVYKDVLNRFPEGTYPGYVTRRAAGE